MTTRIGTGRMRRFLPGLLACIGLILLAADARGAGTRLVFESVLRGEGDAELRWPVGVAAAAPDEVVAADASGKRLVVFRKSEGGWGALRSLTLPGTPAGIAGSGERYLVTTRGPEGLFLVDRGTWTLRPLALPRGSRPGALAAAPDGAFLLHDAGSSQILTLSSSGAVTGRRPAAGRVQALAAAPDGGHYAADALGGAVARFGDDGAERASWRLPGDGARSPFPCALAVSGSGPPIVLDRHMARLLRLEAGGRVEVLGGVRGHEPGRLFYPRAAASLSPDRIAIADSGNGRIQIVRLEPEQ